MLAQYAGAERPAVVDLGAGTGLSTSVWEGRAAHLTAIEPSADMRRPLAERLERWTTTPYQVVEGTAEATGLPAASADIVAAGQAMHWFDPRRALPEIARVLRPGGVFCAFDYDWPPLVDPEVDAAFLVVDARCRELEERHHLAPPRAAKGDHLRLMRESGLFRSTREVALHRVSEGTADDLTGLLETWGSVQALRGAGIGDQEIGLDRLQEVAAARIPGSIRFWWTYRLRLGRR
ncbi:MAG: class I SAM-dependent methyltransferase [Candidatus Dormibacteraceae bacterium]